MVRLFDRHRIRNVKELDGMWDFSMEGVEKRYRLPVPGCWEQHPDFLSHRGKGCYSREVYVEKAGNLRLEFKGVSHTADVFWDGRQIARHYNAFTPFSTVIRHVEKGSHRLEVYVDNTFGEHSALHIPNDYYTYGGITRPAAMESLPDVYIKEMHFTPSRAGDVWSGRVEAVVCNLSDREVRRGNRKNMIRLRRPISLFAVRRRRFPRRERPSWSWRAFSRACLPGLIRRRSFICCRPHCFGRGSLWMISSTVWASVWWRSGAQGCC